MLKSHKFIYVSWLKYSFLKKTNGDNLYMFLLLKVHLAQQNNTLLSDQDGIPLLYPLKQLQGRGMVSEWIPGNGSSPWVPKGKAR